MSKYLNRTLIIADGFSCREQIKSATERQGIHLAQVIKTALDGAPTGTPYPESGYVRQERTYDSKPLIATSAVIVGLSLLGLWRFFGTE